MKPRIRPLTRRNGEGELYTRTPKTQNWLQRLSNLGESDRNSQLVAGVSDNEEEIPVEVLVYFARNAWRAENREGSELLFKALYRRLDAMVQKKGFNSRIGLANELREETMNRLVKAIADDCSGNDKLDYLEVNCAHAVASIFVSVLRKSETQSKKMTTEPLTTQHRETGNEEVSRDAEEAAERFLEQIPHLLDKEAFRSDLYFAIKKLPQDQRAVIIYLMEGMPIYSKDPNVMSIAGTLNCNERTVRNRRDRGIAALSEILGTEADYE